MEVVQVMLKVFQFPAGKNFPNYSPFCSKLEAYLKMNGLPYETVIVKNPAIAPKGKLPFIQDGEVKLADTTFIIQYLKEKHGDKLDSWLTPEQNAIAIAYQRMLEENLAPLIAWFRWVDQEGWSRFQNIVFAGLPFPISKIVPPIMHRNIKKRLYGHGIGRHSKQEILKILNSDLNSLSTFLGSNNYFFGEAPSTLDAIAFGVVGNIVYDPAVQDFNAIIVKYPNLKAHVDRILAQYFNKN